MKNHPLGGWMIILCAHIPAGFQIFELVKRDVELDLNVIVPRHANRFDKLTDKHFLRFKGTGVIEICPAQQPVKFHRLSVCVIFYDLIQSTVKEKQARIIRIDKGQFELLLIISNVTGTPSTIG